jgi:hypothetical protein
MIFMLRRQRIFLDTGQEFNFKENVRNSYASIACPLCQVPPDSQAHSVQCPVIKTKVQVVGIYSDIFAKDEFPKGYFQNIAGNIGNQRKSVVRRIVSMMEAPVHPPMLQTDPE